jgi:hypothetical protein
MVLECDCNAFVGKFSQEKKAVCWVDILFCKDNALIYPTIIEFHQYCVEVIKIVHNALSLFVYILLYENRAKRFQKMKNILIIFPKKNIG